MALPARPPLEMPRSAPSKFRSVLALAGAALPAALGAADSRPSAADVEFFEREVRPVLATHCYSCHGAANAMSDLRLDSREAVLQGGVRGPAAAPGRPDASVLIQAVRHESLRMPLGGRISPDEIASLEEWVRRGLPWPERSQAATEADIASLYPSMRREHWAFQPVRRPSPPAVANSAWSDHPVDRFILAKLEEAGLKPSPPADRAVWIRRLSFALTGLPPTPGEVQAFVGDTTPGARRRAVDRLLDSPHFGERWARHWMDVVRFAETLGNDWNYENNGAWLYRDYLIRAFNEDVPYADLVREHLAGDLLPEPRLGAAGAVNESLIGTFFFRLGEQGHDDCTQFREVRTDVVDDQIDTLGKAFQGLTIACARCHDHKLDPIPTADYYRLYGVLDSSRLVTRTVDSPAANRPLKDRLRGLKVRIREELGRYWLGEAETLEAHLRSSARSERIPALAAGQGSSLDPERAERIRSLVEQGDLGLEHPLYPWARLAGPKAEGPAASLFGTWEGLVERYERHSRWRAEFNAENFEALGDFGSGDLSGWHAEGQAFEPVFAADGAYAVAPDGDRVVSGVFPAGVYTHLLSEKLNGAFRSPYLPRHRKYASFRVVGGKLAAWRTVLDNCMLSERYQFLEQDKLGWIKIPLRDEHDEYRLYAELVTKHDNPRLPDRPDRMKDVAPERMADPRSYFGITRAVLHDCDELPEAELSHMRRILEGDPPADLAALAGRYAAAARAAVSAWAAGRASADDARWLAWLLENRLLANSKYLTPRLRELVDEYRAVERRLNVPQVIQGMADLESGRDVPILRAGDPANPGETVPRGFLSLLAALEPAANPRGSGRLELAETIADPANPLTARVMANRIWHHLFGQGIVPTVDNFGRFGEPPSHPELLDYLAGRFRERGWSIKDMVRHIALSRTFEQSSAVSREAGAADPGNRLFHRYPARRLDAESIRDAVLAVSGTLSPSLYGPSVHPYRASPKAYRKLFSGPLDGAGRRSLYLKVTRHEGAAFLEALDFPKPSVARGRRDVTNVPRQALTLLNDPFVAAEAQAWARALIAESSESVQTRLVTMFRAALGRRPDRRERIRFESLAGELAELHGARPDAVLTSLPVWQGVAHALFNLKEFSYIR